MRVTSALRIYLGLKVWKRACHVSGKQQKARVAILISDKIDFKPKMITREKEGHYIMMER